MNIFTQPNAAISGGGCMERPGRRRPKAETPVEPQESVELSTAKQNAKLATQLATELANSTGAEASVEVGGIKVTIKPGKGHAAHSNKPIAMIDEEPAKEDVRPEVKSFVDSMRDGHITGVRHTTRSIQMPQKFQPQAPQPFGAGRFAVEFTDPQGNEKGMIVQTEAKVGHLHNVVPGQTDIGGHISILSDAKNTNSETTQLNTGEQDYLLAALYAKFDKPMLKSEADAANFCISSTAAVRFSGQGAAAVSARHEQLAGAAAQPAADSGPVYRRGGLR